MGLNFLAPELAGGASMAVFRMMRRMDTAPTVTACMGMHSLPAGTRPF